MSLKPIKPGSPVYIREGKFKTSYWIKYRRGGIHIEQPLHISDAELFGLGTARIKEMLEGKAWKIINEQRDKKEREKIDQLQIKTQSPLARFDTIINDVINSKKTLSTRKTVKFYLEKCVLPILNEKCPYVQDFPLTGPEDFISWYQDARPNERVFNARKYFLQVLKRARKAKLLHPDIDLESVPNPDPESDAGKVYSDEEIKALFENALPELRLQILMAFTMGMRKSEILKLRWSRIDWNRQTIRLRPEDTKTRMGREFSVVDAVFAILLERRNAQVMQTEFVFPSTLYGHTKRPKVDTTKPIRDNKSAWQACKRRAKVTGRFHDLRHTFLTREVAQKKHQAMDVCIYAGVSVEEMKRTYLHPNYLDTAYIAKGQNEKIASIFPIYKNLGKPLGKKTAGSQYA